ncbi:hypothetical protein CYG49_04780 [Candidatus Saccharibacteria bacterium]|nr:MAG: hypothetical protein CYG49_04780 [Candidatus Saccharibacteria bacterium]
MFEPLTADDILTQLQNMELDSKLITKDAYSPNAELYPDGRIPFIDIHLNYLRTHKHVDPKNYLSNLRLMITPR